MQHDSTMILSVLDDCSRKFTFPGLDNGYVYLAASRLSLYRSETDWGMVIEIFGYSPRSGIPDIHVYTFASRLYNRNKSDKYVNPAAYQNYLANNPCNESRFFYPIEEGTWMDAEHPEMVSKTGEVRLRNLHIPLPSRSEYQACGIEIADKQPAVFELTRYLAATHRTQVLGTDFERRVSILPEMALILGLDEWHHPDIVGSELPSQTETFQQLARVLATGDVSHYNSGESPNTHWKHWPEGGSL